MKNKEKRNNEQQTTQPHKNPKEYGRHLSPVRENGDASVWNLPHR